MSGNYYSDVLGDDYEEQSSGGGLRKQLEEALREIRSLREDLNKEKRVSTVVTALTEKGIDPKVAQLVPEGADPAKWLEEFGSYFRTVKGEHLDKDEQPPADAAKDAALEAEKAAFQQMQEVQGGDTSTVVNEDPEAKLRSFLQSGTEAELMKYMQENGMGVTPGDGVFR